MANYFNDGVQQEIWEPLYRMQIALTACEQTLLQTPAVRRLQRVHHYGAATRVLPMTHTRFIHTLGVFALVVHFCPDDYPLRLAALLHDVGHLPFSHSAERALGIDHHDLTVRVIIGDTVSTILTTHGFDPAQIVALISGSPRNPLFCGADGMSLDHLDSWLRDSAMAGIGEIPAHQLLARLHLNGPFVEAADEESAMDVVLRVTADHRLFLHPRCLALDALVTEIFRRADLSVNDMIELGDESALDRALATAPELVHLLRDRPWAIDYTEGAVGGPGVVVTVKKVYMGEILLDGAPVTERLPKAVGLYSGLQQLIRSYTVQW